MSQDKYTCDILNKFNMMSSKSNTNPLEIGLKLYINDEYNPIDANLHCQLVGIFIYLMTTQPHIYIALNMVSRFMSDPWKIHWKEVKINLRYLHDTIEYGLLYRSTKNFKLISYVDSEWVGYINDIKSIVGYKFNNNFLEY